MKATEGLVLLTQPILLGHAYVKTDFLDQTVILLDVLLPAKLVSLAPIVSVQHVLMQHWRLKAITCATVSTIMTTGMVHNVNRVTHVAENVKDQSIATVQSARITLSYYS